MSEHTHAAPSATVVELTPEQKLEQEKKKAIEAASKVVINVVSEDKKTTVPLPAIGAAFRNGVAIPFFETNISRVKAGSEKDGISYPAPHIAWIKENPDTFFTWVGVSTIVRWVSSKIKTVLQTLHEEACEDLVDADHNVIYYPRKKQGDPLEAKPDYTKFHLEDWECNGVKNEGFWTLVETLSPRSETLAEIKSAMVTLALEMAEMDVEKFIAKAGGNEAQGFAEFRLAQKAIKTQIQTYNVALEQKRRHKTESLQGDDATDSVSAPVQK